MFFTSIVSIILAVLSDFFVLVIALGLVAMASELMPNSNNLRPAGKNNLRYQNGALMPGTLRGVNMSQGIELSLECTNLAPKRLIERLFVRTRRPFIVLYKRHMEKWTVSGRTETILHDVRHRFVTKFNVRFNTSEDRHTPLRVEVYDGRNNNKIHKRNLIGAVEFSMDEILSEPLFQKQLGLSSSRAAGILWISGDPIRYGCSDPLASQTIRLKLKFSPKAKGPIRSFYVISREMESGEYTAVHRSEVISNDNSFKMMLRNAAAMTAGCEDTPLRIEVYQINGRSSHIRLGHIQTSFRNMKDVVGTKQRLFWRPSAILTTRKKMINIEQAVLVDKVVGSRTSEFLVELR